MRYAQNYQLFNFHSLVTQVTHTTTMIVIDRNEARNDNL